MGRRNTGIIRPYHGHNTAFPTVFPRRPFRGRTSLVDLEWWSSPRKPLPTRASPAPPASGSTTRYSEAEPRNSVQKIRLLRSDLNSIISEHFFSHISPKIAASSRIPAPPGNTGIRQGIRRHAQTAVDAKGRTCSMARSIRHSQTQHSRHETSRPMKCPHNARSVSRCACFAHTPTLPLPRLARDSQKSARRSPVQVWNPPS